MARSGPTAARRPWTAVAVVGAVAAVTAAAVALGGGGGGAGAPTVPSVDTSAPPPTASTSAGTSSPNILPPEGVNGDAWVVVSVGGSALDRRTDVPAFAVSPAGVIVGFDGCNSVSVDHGVLSGGTRSCPGITPLLPSGTDEYQLVTDDELHVGDIVAARFGHRPLDETAAFAGKVWAYEPGSVLTFNPDGAGAGRGSVIAGDPSCLFFGTYVLEKDSLTVTSDGAVPSCLADTFEEWLSVLTDGNRCWLALRDGELWVLEQQYRVTRLTPG